MTLLTELSENFNTGPSNGTAITTGNTVIDSLTGTGTFVFANDIAAPEGTFWAKATTTTGLVNALMNANTTHSQFYTTFYFRSGTPSAVYAFYQTSSAGTAVMSLRLDVDMTVQIRDFNTTRYTTPALSPNTTYQFEIRCTPAQAAGATGGTFVNIYTEGGSLVHSSGGITLSNTATATLDAHRIGVIAGSPTVTAYWDRIRVDDATSPGIVAPDPVVANAGADQTNIEPYSTVTLTGSATGGDSTYTYSWAQISGPSVTLSGTGASRTFTAPAGQSGSNLVFRLTADDGADSDTDDVTISVLSHNLFTKVGGAFFPRRKARRHTGSWVDL